MAKEHPQLVFLAGPDAGRTILLDRLPVTMGRSSACGLQLKDEYASREQVRFDASPEGVVVDTLSSRGTDVAGRMYKRGKRILLGTGDLIRCGLETEILFVGAGDDAKAAMAELQARRKAEAEQRRAEQAAGLDRPAERPGEALAEVEPEAAVSRKAAVVEEPEAKEVAPPKKALTAAQVEAMERQKRRKKVFIGLGIYLGLIVIAGIALSLRDKTSTSDVGLSPLGDEQIRQNLPGPTDISTPSSLQAANKLEEARRHYNRRQINDGALYYCLAAYRDYLAYSGRSSFESSEDLRNYEQAQNDLRERVLYNYNEALRAVQQERWSTARGHLQKVLDLVPDVTNPINSNAMRYLARVQEKMRSRPGGGSPFGR